jgi:hypothetical protein
MTAEVPTRTTPDSRLSRRETVRTVAVEALLGALFPTLMRRARSPLGLGPRGWLAWLTATTLLLYGLRELVGRARATYEQVAAEARARLGREPTRDEICDAYVRRFLRGDLGREPTDAEVARFRESSGGE